MKLLLQSVRKWDFWQDDQGQDLIEYALMVGFVAVTAVVMIPALMTKVNALFTGIGTKLDAATPK